MKAGSLFSGIGGLDLGLERAGMEIRWQVEVDPFCVRVLEKHWPHVQRYGDIRTLRGDELEPVDLLCGGFPCQDLSVAGCRAGLAGRRSNLYWEFHRLAACLAPRWVLIENVPGLLSSNAGRDFRLILNSLVELGYSVAWRILDAQYFGVAQRRRRAFIVGHLGEPWSAPAAVLFESESCDGNPPPSRAAGEEVAGTVAGGSYGTGRRTEDDPNLVIAGTLGGGSGQRGWCDDLDRCGAFVPELGRSLMAPQSPRYDGDTETFVIQDVRGGTRDKTDDGQGIGIRCGGPMYTLGAVERHAVATRLAVRRLTPLECERLQGFPDGWTAGLSDSARYRMLGNAVCVPVAEWIGSRIIDQERRR